MERGEMDGERGDGWREGRWMERGEMDGERGDGGTEGRWRERGDGGREKEIVSVVMLTIVLK